MTKKRLLIIIMTIIWPLSLAAENDIIGRIVLKEGAVVKTNLNCAGGICTDDMLIRKGDRIRTGKKARAQVLLNDGTGLIIYERSDLILNYVIISGSRRPTEIYIEYGMCKIIQNNSFLETSLIINTKNSLVKTVNATFCLIAAEMESGIFVSAGEAGFASIENSVSDAYIIKEGEESFIRSGLSPAVPSRVPATLQGSWLSRMLISKDKKNILRSNVKKGPVDWPFQKKD